MIGRDGRAASIERRPAPAGDTLLAAQGGFRSQRQATWRLGAWSLSPQRLVFDQSDKRILDLPLEKITAIALERCKFILVRKLVVRLTYLHPRTNNAQNAWLIVAGVAQWAETLRQLTGIGAETATSRREPLGGPLSQPPGESPYEAAPDGGLSDADPLFEVHDEAAALLVVAVVPGLKQETMRAEVSGRSLHLAAETAHGPYALSVPLPCRVQRRPIHMNIANNVLSARLVKVAWR